MVTFSVTSVSISKISVSTGLVFQLSFGLLFPNVSTGLAFTDWLLVPSTSISLLRLLTSPEKKNLLSSEASKINQNNWLFNQQSWLIIYST